ncbi:hypothetical protein [Agrobacterium burrii]
MLKEITITVGLLCAATPAAAEKEYAHPMPTWQTVRLDPGSGCFRYQGTAAEFVGRFRRGSYVTVTMDDPERIPFMDAPEYIAPGSLTWYGPLPASRDYSIGFMPALLFGSPGKVVICGTTTPPASPEDAVRADRAVREMLDSLGEQPTAPADGRQADICGFPARDIAIRAGEGADASPLQPRVAGNVRHYAHLSESPFDVFAVCTPQNPRLQTKTVKLPGNTKDCYFAGGKLECSYLNDGETVSAD